MFNLAPEQQEMFTRHGRSLPYEGHRAELKDHADLKAAKIIRNRELLSPALQGDRPPSACGAPRTKQGTEAKNESPETGSFALQGKERRSQSITGLVYSLAAHEIPVLGIHIF